MTGVTVKLQGVEVMKVNEFEYMGLTLQRDEQSISEVKKSMQAGWSGGDQGWSDL